MDLLLSPIIEDLMCIDTIGLAQKKANNFIRKNNWFYNAIELDKSNVLGQKQINDWIVNLKRKNFTTKKVNLVPAPKNSQWSYKGNKWEPLEKVNLRILADVGYRDQTFGIAVLMTLANMVETLQGPSFLPGIEAKKYGVKSYGNRLLCHWFKESETYKANFSLGSSQIYKKYFDDFEKFIERPITICDLNVSLGINAEDLVILSFDIKDFFNNINIRILIKKINNLIDKHREMKTDNSSYLSTVEKILTFEVDLKNTDNKKILDIEKNYILGLPQGYAASGFLSNVYMLDFDNEIEERIAENISGDFEILDYIRYVDDIRIVVKKNKEKNSEKISEEIEKEINSYFSTEYKYHDGRDNRFLKINSDKIEYTTYNNYKNISNSHKSLQVIQRKLSTAPDYETLEEILSSLENMIEISKIVTDKKKESSFSFFEKDITKNNFKDIKVESIQKFAGYRLYKSIILKNNLVNSQELSNVSLDIYEKKLINEREKYIDRLMNLFLDNPALFQFLRYALDLLPDRDLVRKIFRVLNSVDRNNKKSLYISYFVKMDIFTASITYIGYSKKNNYDQKKLKEFRREIAILAKETLSDKEIPVYLKNAALLVILSFDHSILFCSKNLILTGDIKKLVDVVLNCEKETEINEKDFVYYLLNYQIKKDLVYLVNTLNKLYSDNLNLFYNFLDLVWDYDLELVTKLFKEESFKLELTEKIREKYYISKDIVLVNGGNYSFLDIISNKNPFKDENAILSLLEKLLYNEDFLFEISRGNVNFANLKIKVSNWEKLSNPKYARKNIIIEITENKGSKFIFPSWCMNREDKISYFLGALLRSALASRVDYLSNKSNNTKVGYKGLDNNNYVKRISLNNFRDNINNNEAPITNEVMELLFSLLWYPGLYIPKDAQNYFGDILRIKREIINILKEREEYYCTNSELPGYVYKMKKVVNKKNKINILSVQSLFPDATDFFKVFPNYVSNNFRRQHRQHIASIIDLIKSYLKVQMNEKGDVDIIVFPEISINPNDIDLIEQLSDETGAHIFAGLTYSYLNEDEETFKNEALWLLRDDSVGGRNFVKLIQGKRYPTNSETKMNVRSHKENQIIVEFNFNGIKFRVAGAICYDATDINLASDLRHKSDLFIISAYNKDISTFDNMVAALNYHMYQPVILVNCGYNGGSMVQAPYKGHEKLMSSIHGGKQVALSLAEFNISDFKNRSISKEVGKETKTSPAGFLGRD